MIPVPNGRLIYARQLDRARDSVEGSKVIGDLRDSNRSKDRLSQLYIRARR